MVVVGAARERGERDGKRSGWMQGGALEEDTKVGGEAGRVTREIAGTGMGWRSRGGTGDGMFWWW